MKRCTTILAAALFALMAGHAAVAQGYTPMPRIVRPTVLPDPIGNRLAPKPKRIIEQAVIKPSDN